MRIGTKSSLFFLLFLALTAAGAPENRAKEAALHFEQGQWAKAQQIYRELAGENELAGPDLFFNYGIAALQAGAAGEAYSSLMKAAFLSPFDSEVKRQIETAQGKMPEGARALRPSTWISWWPPQLHFFSWQPWLILAMALLAPALWAAARTGSARRPWQTAAMGFAAVFLLLGLISLWQLRIPAAGVLKEAKALSGPGASYPEIGNLPAGAIVNLEEKREGWLKVRYFDPGTGEKVGWIESSSALPLR